MKKGLIIMAALCLTACTPLPTYYPTLATPAKDQARYYSDLSACKDKVIGDAMASGRDTAPLGVLGGAGGLIADMSTPRKKEPYLQVNDCMTGKGYIIAGDGR